MFTKDSSDTTPSNPTAGIEPLDFQITPDFGSSSLATASELQPQSEAYDDAALFRYGQLAFFQDVKALTVEITDVIPSEEPNEPNIGYLAKEVRLKSDASDSVGAGNDTRTWGTSSTATYSPLIPLNPNDVFAVGNICRVYSTHQGLRVWVIVHILAVAQHGHTNRCGHPESTDLEDLGVPLIDNTLQEGDRGAGINGEIPIRSIICDETEVCGKKLKISTTGEIITIKLEDSSNCGAQ